MTAISAIDERAAQLGEEVLGPALSPELTLSTWAHKRMRLKAFENAVLLDVPGVGVYVLAEATQAQKFRAPSGP